MKIASASRETCAGFGQRISEVLAVISDAETTKKVLNGTPLNARGRVFIFSFFI